MDPVRTQVFSIIAAFFSLAPSAITDRTRASEVDGWDSIRHAELVFEIEDALDIELTLKAVQAAQDVGELADVVVAAVRAARP